MADRAKACRVLCVTALLACRELVVCLYCGLPPSSAGSLVPLCFPLNYLYTYSCAAYTPRPLGPQSPRPPGPLDGKPLPGTGRYTT
jgi:hypothetical protein